MNTDYIKQHYLVGFKINESICLTGIPHLPKMTPLQGDRRQVLVQLWQDKEERCGTPDSQVVKVQLKLLTTDKD